MKTSLDIIHDMLVKLQDDVEEIKDEQVQQRVILDEHIRRTELLESEMRPVRKHVYMVQGVGAFIGLLALVATIVVAFK